MTNQLHRCTALLLLSLLVPMIACNTHSVHDVGSEEAATGDVTRDVERPGEANVANGRLNTITLIQRTLLDEQPAAVANRDTTLRFRVRLSPSVADKPLTGRLFVYVSPGNAGIDMGINSRQAVPMYAVDVVDFQPGSCWEIDGTADAYPGPISSLSDMTAELDDNHYSVMAVLHCDHDSNEPGKGIGDVTGMPVSAKIDALTFGAIDLELSTRVARQPAPGRLNIDEISVVSKMLSDFHGREISEQASVILPPSYTTHPGRYYPVVYCVPAYNETHRDTQWASGLARGTSEVDVVEAICVVLNGHCQWGHHAYANSDTHGPRGDALIREMIPWIESKYRAVSEATARFVTGHSSGGWSSLWLQINYPETFGGVWSSAPDPVDFRDFLRVNLYAEPPESMFVDAKGRRRILTRLGDMVDPTFNGPLWGDRFFRLDDCLGRGGQMRSFEAVFSPLGSDGEPLKLWNRTTGRTDPRVASAWKRYDIRLLLEKNWESLGPKLAGKLHISVGAADSYYLDRSVTLLAESLRTLGSDAQIDFVPDPGHQNNVNMVEMLKEIGRIFLTHHADRYIPNPPEAPQGAASSYVLEKIRESDGRTLNLGPPEATRPFTQRVAPTPRVTDFDLEPIGQLKDLSSLILRGASISSAGLRFLAKLQSLTFLDVSSTSLDDASLTHIATLGQLRVLNLERTRISNAGLEKLSPLTQLTELSIGYTEVDDEGLKTIGKVSGLQKLDLSQMRRITDDGLQHLKHLSQLTEMKLPYTETTDRGLEHLCMLTRLRALDLSHTSIGDQGVDYLCKLSSLHSLNLQNSLVTAEGLKRLKESLPHTEIVWTAPRMNEERVELYLPLRAGELNYLARLPRLDSLHLIGSGVRPTGGTADSIALRDLTQLDNLRATLHETRIVGLRLADDDWDNLTKLSQINSVVIMRTTLRDAGLAKLAQLPNLRNLEIPATSVTDDALTHVAAMKHLTALNLSDTEIGDEGLRNLRELAELENLNLEGCALLTDASIQHLLALKGLKKLQLNRTGISRGGIALLKNGMPGCRTEVTEFPNWWDVEWYRPLPPLRSVDPNDVARNAGPTDSTGESPLRLGKILVDASKSTPWWLSLQNAHRTRHPNGGKQDWVDFQKKLGWHVDELQLATRVTAEVLTGYDIVIRPSFDRPYDPSESEAYRQAISAGVKLLLFPSPLSDEDPIGAAFGLRFANYEQVGAIGRYVRNPLTVSLLRVEEPVNAVEATPDQAVNLAWLSGESSAALPIAGYCPYGKGAVVYLSLSTVFMTGSYPQRLGSILPGHISVDRRRRVCFDALDDVLKYLVKTSCEDLAKSTADPTCETVPALGMPPRLLSPEVGAEMPHPNAGDRRFAWEPLSGTQRYQLSFNGGAPLDVSDAFFVHKKPESEFQQIAGRDRLNLSWQVRAMTVDGSWGPWSEPRRFNIREDETLPPGVRQPPPDASSDFQSPAETRRMVIDPRQNSPPMRGEYLLLSPSAGAFIAPTMFSGDGRWLIVGSGDPDLPPRLWDLCGDKPVLREVALPRFTPNQATFSADSNWLVILVGEPADMRPHIFNLGATPTAASGMLLDHKGITTLPLFTANGCWLITRSRVDNRLWNLTGLQPAAVPIVFPGPQEVRSWGPFLASPDGRWLVAGERLIDLNQGDPLASPHSLPIGVTPRFLRFSSDGRRALLGTQLLDLSQDDPVSKASALSIDTRAMRAEFSEDRRWLATGSVEQTQIWDLAVPDPATTVTQLPGPGGGAARVPLDLHFTFSFSPGHHWFITATCDGETRLINLSTPPLSSRALAGSPGGSQRAADFYGRLCQMTADDRWLAVGHGGALQLWDLTAENLGQEPALLLASGDFTNRRAQLSPDGRWLLAAEPGKTMQFAGAPKQQPAQLWDLSKGDPAASLLTLPQDCSYGGVFSPDGRWLVTTVSVGEMSSPQLDDSAAWFLAGDTSPSFPVRLKGVISRSPMGAGPFSPNARWLVTAGEGGLRLWDLNALSATNARSDASEESGG